MKIDIEDRFIWEVTLSLEQAREIAGVLDCEDLDIALDEAQGEVHSNTTTRTAVIVYIER